MKSFGERTVQMPCTDCLVTWIQAGLESLDGTVANADTEMWLHHTVFSNTQRTSVVCPTMTSGDRFFASGNERTPANICVNGTDHAGYYIGSDDNFGMIAEFMNMKEEPRDVIFTMTYEFIPRVPAGFDKVRSMWLDIGGCHSSSFPAERDTAFQYSSPVFRSNSTGRVTSIFSHLHDGGVNIEVMKNGKVVCDAKAAYGQCGSGSMMKDDAHISSISECNDLGSTTPGDEWSLAAYYDTSKHSPMTNMDGSLEPVMGISLVYFAETMDCMPTPAHHHHRGRLVAIVLSCVLVAAIVGGLVWAHRQGHSFRDVLVIFRRNSGRIFLRDSDRKAGDGLPLLSEEE